MPRKQPKRASRVTSADLRAAGASTKRRSAAQIAQEVLARKKLQRQHEIALLDADVKKVDIERTLEQRGKKVSHTTVSSVIAGTFRNADVEDVFCELTGTQRSVMFPSEISETPASSASTP
jgi:hypothetical protein